ncbi:GlsB/YeaQ/YmgE family stress response membrane protein [Cryptosporangium phraense]|uniref:GlsB/YeaQ/YmgE family stress response membrane protein n=1 Tax=Cryptosporangium phraense TaxID=2593070 RepID=A0A545AUT0_9ACTN|nr:GlsB/YeaQ/YmgE family stress response membrane protein [Cryptosporangium phraense]TQS45086.1 GlsB/YeaQ/YmgE family stress response membrane protein [Cryptosporangium phraense]
MEIDGIISALFVGLIIGAVGRLVMPGKQRVGLLMTLVIGIVAALLGTGVASVFGVADTPGVDWLELFAQIGLAAVGVSLVSGAKDRPKITSGR